VDLGWPKKAQVQLYSPGGEQNADIADTPAGSQGTLP